MKKKVMILMAAVAAGMLSGGSVVMAEEGTDSLESVSAFMFPVSEESVPMAADAK